MTLDPTNKINDALAARVARVLRVPPDAWETFQGEAAPLERLYFYFRVLSFGWLGLGLVSIFVIGLLAYIGQVVAGGHGRLIGVSLGLGLTVSLLAGSADALWRFFLVQAARRRSRRRRREDGRNEERLLRLAQARTSTIWLQTLAGVIAVLAQWP